MAGLPIACSNYNNLEKLVNNNPIGKVGDTFDVLNPEDIAKSIDMCLKNKDMFKKNALILAKKYINWEKQEDNIIAKIKSL